MLILLNDHKVTNSDQRLLYVTASISSLNDPSKKGPLLTVRRLPCAVLTVLMLPALPPYPRRVRGPPTMIFAAAGDVVPLPSLVVPNLGTTNDVGGTTAVTVASVD